MWGQLQLRPLPIVLAMLDTSHITRGLLFPYVNHHSFIPQTSTESPRTQVSFCLEAHRAMRRHRKQTVNGDKVN